MKAKNKLSGRNSEEVASPRVSLRQQKKVVENGQIQAKKVTELITSSARKKKVVGTPTNATEEPIGRSYLDDKFRLVDFDDSNVCLAEDDQHEVGSSLINNKVQDQDNEISNCVTGTIFSPSFHTARSIGSDISSRDFYEFFQHGSQQFDEKENIQMVLPGTGTLSPEVSAMYLSARSSNLECVDENNQGHMSGDGCHQDEDNEEFDDFDPYLFMRNLPDLSSVVPIYRPVLLPKQTRSCPSTTLVLDLDETLVHSTLEPCDDSDFTFPVNFNMMEHTVYVRCRPYLRDFLEKVSGRFEIIIFTASQSIYADQLLNILDPKREIFRHRVFRESCVLVDGNYVKDLSVLGRDLARVIIIDNSPQAFGFQVDNGIPIESWFDDRSDTELLMLLPFLETLVGVQDVRPLISQKYNLREKIQAADCSLDYM